MGRGEGEWGGDGKRGGHERHERSEGQGRRGRRGEKWGIDWGKCSLDRSRIFRLPIAS
jgi:hypothetical protein